MTKEKRVTISGKGRHDPCVVPRAVPIVEAMAALVIVDFLNVEQKRAIRTNNQILDYLSPD